MIKNMLKAKRKDGKLSQEQFADLLFMSQSQYNRREKGIIKISSGEWKRMAQILNVNVKDIFESDDTLFNITHYKSEENNFENGIEIKIKIPINDINGLSKTLDKLLKILDSKL